MIRDIVTRDANSLSRAKFRQFFKIALWCHLWRHHHKNTCIWHNLICWLRFCHQNYNISGIYNHRTSQMQSGNIGTWKWIRIFFSHVWPSPKYEFREQYSRSHCDVTDDIVMAKVIPFSHNFLSRFHIWSQIEAVMCITWILKILENGFDFPSLRRFQTETKPGGRLNKKDGLTRYGNSHVKDKTS